MKIYKRMTNYRGESLCLNYYHLLNKLEDLNLKHTREILPEYLNTIVQENLSFVEALNHLMTEEINSRNERQKENRLIKANLP